MLAASYVNACAQQSPVLLSKAANFKLGEPTIGVSELYNAHTLMPECELQVIATAVTVSLAFTGTPAMPGIRVPL